MPDLAKVDDASAQDMVPGGARLARRSARLIGTTASALLCSTVLAGAAEHPISFSEALAAIAPHEWAAFGLHVGVVVFGVVTGIGLLRTKAQAITQGRRHREEIAGLKLALDRSNELLTLDPHVVVVWNGDAEEPSIWGDVSLVVELPAARSVLAFGSWLAVEKAQVLERAAERLRSSGTPFKLEFVTLQGRAVEAEGRPIGGRAVLRLRLVSGVRAELAQLRDEHDAVVRDTDAIRSFLSALPMPVWLRDAEGRLTWVNEAYASATETENGPHAVARGIELLEPADRTEAARLRAERSPFSRRVTAVSAGARRVFDAIERPAALGSAGLAIDVTELEAVRSELVVEMETHKRTLDQLATAVAIFDARKRLVFHNEAFRQLWGLDPAFLHQAPTDGDLLDRLREQRKLPEQPNFREWKASLHSVYQAVDTEPRIHEWPLPGGRFLRVVQNPDPAGGVTYVFDDLTQRLLLETQVAAFGKVQRETLDTLDEAVAVFGSDGRLTLHNRAFRMLWDLDQTVLDAKPHIDQIAGACLSFVKEPTAFSQIKGAVTGLNDQRRQQASRIERSDNSVLDAVTAPLPDGATLVTFRNVTDMVMVERALTERNEALEMAAKIRNDFVHHVSYQLRTPLTTIIGFAQVLDNDAVGALNDKQREYLGYIGASSASLLSIINDVLDLATIDAGVMQLELTDVDIRAAMQAAVDAVQDRLAENQTRVEMRCAKDIGSFRADAQRVRQVLFNLLSNAIGFSDKGGLVVIDASREGDEIVFKVRDQGQGIAPDLMNRIFDRFETRSTGTQHRGAGLGLSIVQSFVTLHKGHVSVDSTPGQGTLVKVTFPANLADYSKAAE
ncbi:PAS domain-containing protein [Phreatobacter aquaticus]|uniref:histidine kinase n=1 Tax=Phreatobacter aquaticus TaxID=2570229 RepID=A0A4D7QN90_9HYPH|nr:ATP-binding protein [Phreatobacter aquaticus]QCK85632.1 PAS domain-containing protein [Phreatobacter aquaticus]